jgi:hypothetical protein
VKFICDRYGKIVKTSLNSRGEVEDEEDSKVIYWHCKQAAALKSKD